jgi:hypothetical protein
VEPRKSLKHIFQDTAREYDPTLKVSKENRSEIYTNTFQRAKVLGYTRGECEMFINTLIDFSVFEKYRDKAKLDYWKFVCRQDANIAITNAFYSFTDIPPQDAIPLRERMAAMAPKIEDKVPLFSENQKARELADELGLTNLEDNLDLDFVKLLGEEDA